MSSNLRPIPERQILRLSDAYEEPEKGENAVMSSILYEYNEEETLAYIAEEQYGLGHREGIEQGDTIKVLSLIRKKIQKNLSISVIADMLELEMEYVEKAVQLLQEFPDKSDGEIAEEFL